MQWMCVLTECITSFAYDHPVLSVLGALVWGTLAGCMAHVIWKALKDENQAQTETREWLMEEVRKD